MAGPEDDWERLIAAVDCRLDELTIKLKDIEERGGPSTSKIRELRNGRSKTLVRSKRRDLERALEWQHGSVDWILAGGDPRPLEKGQVGFGAPPQEGEWLRGLNTESLWRLYTEVSGEIRRRIPDNMQEWPEGWSTGKGEDPSMRFHQDRE